MKRLVIILLVVFYGLQMSAQPREYIFREYMAENGQILPYAVLYPENFDPQKQYPMLLFLHGSGERGRDGKKQLKHGGEFFASSPLLKEVIFIAPQCPREDAWACYSRPAKETEKNRMSFPDVAPISSSLTAVKELLDSFISLGFADPAKVYACGLSLGAIGILDLTMRYPDYFDSIQPICGGVGIGRCANFTGKTRFRFFHGEEDNAVLPRHSVEADSTLRASGVHSELILYPGVGHPSWFNAFDEPDFLSWMLR